MADRRFGGFWRRLWAFCIDKAILYVLTLLLYLIGLTALGAAGVSPVQVAIGGDLPRELGLLFAVYLAASLVAGMTYFTGFHGTLGRTPGKMALGLRVVQASGEAMTLGVAFLRWTGSLVSTLAFGLGYLWIAVDARKQGWHDKIAATLVVRSAGAADKGDTASGSNTTTGGSDAAETEVGAGAFPCAASLSIIPVETSAESCLSKDDTSVAAASAPTAEPLPASPLNDPKKNHGG
jgi:uncharacterized RDD family membrane protein YckC